MVKPKDELEAALDEASSSNGNKTLIIAMINKAYVQGENPLLNLFLESFWLGNNTQALVDQLLLVTLDQIALDRCKYLRLHCYGLVTDGVDYSGEKLYMSDDFIKMMWRRTNFLADVLKRGYNFVFT
ncbi:Nucleotide-diphospho-sugar transferase family protein, partial [Thalictrum thalictroides]